MYFNPIYQLSGILVRFVVGRVNLPSLFSLLASNLLFVSRHLIRNQGLFPTIYGLYALYRTIQNGNPLTSFINNNRINPIVSSTIGSLVSNHWGDCLRYAPIINSSFYMYACGIILSSFSSITYKVLGFTAGLICTSLGIVTNQTLCAVPFLKYLGMEVLDFFADHFNFKFFRSVSDEVIGNSPRGEPVVSIHPTDYNDGKINPYMYIGIILLGLVGITASLVVADKMNHDFISHIPGVSSYVEYINSSLNNIFQYFTSKPTGPTAPSAPTVEKIPSTWESAPEAINRPPRGPLPVFDNTSAS